MKTSSRSNRIIPDRPMGKPKLLFVGEGPADVGRPEFPGGALAGFLTAVLAAPGPAAKGADLPFVISSVKRWTTDAPLLPRSSGKPTSFRKLLSGYEPDTRRAHAFLLLAKQLDMDGVVIIRDCERRGNVQLGSILRAAGALFDERKAPTEIRPGFVVAAPSRAHEKWLLADREAVRSVLDSEALFSFSGDPEERPSAETLKVHLSKHCQRLHQNESDCRRELAFRARPDELSRRCPQCYPDFVKDVETELGEEKTVDDDK
ncbi:MAG: hypothetical protein ACKV0T_07295 [Planctomycetales bacterium]